MSAREPIRADPAPRGQVARASLDGFPLPPAFFLGGAGTLGFLVHLRPRELAYYSDTPAAPLLERCGAVLGVAPRCREVRDVYFDTPDRRLFRAAVSVRVRAYPGAAEPLPFEVVCVGWRGPAERGGWRTNGVVVQSFQRPAPDGMRRLAEQYRRAGLVPVAEVRKTRTAFELHPLVTRSAAGAPRVGCTRLPAAEGDRRAVDHGLRVLVDEIHGGAFPAGVVLEVEFDVARAPAARAVVSELSRGWGGLLRPKHQNKIAHLLGGAAA